MDLLRHLVLFVHFLGLASLIGGALVQVRSAKPAIIPAIRDGAWTQLVTGLILVVIRELTATPEHPVNHAKIGVKLIIALVVVVLVVLNRKKEAIDRNTLLGILGLSVLNVGVATLW